jgi:hypothetical protein
MRRAAAAAVFSVLLTTVALVACESDPSAPSASSSSRSTIGAAGGVVETEGARLTLPAGALAQPTEITIEATTGSGPPTYDALSPVFQFGPAGLHFAVPITVELTYAGDGSGATVLWSTEDGAAYESLATTLDGTGRASAQVLHFSRGLVGRNRSAPPVSSLDAGASPSSDEGGVADASVADASASDGSSDSSDAGTSGPNDGGSNDAGGDTNPVDGGSDAGGSSGGPGPGCYPSVSGCNRCCSPTQCCGPGQCCALPP